MNALETILIAAAFLLVAVLWVVLYPRPRLRLTERGLCDRDARVGWIGWDEIEGAYPPSSHDADGLTLRLRPGAGLRRRLRRCGGEGPAEDGSWQLRLDLSEADVGAVELMQEVLARCGPLPRDAAVGGF